MTAPARPRFAVPWYVVLLWISAVSTFIGIGVGIAEIVPQMPWLGWRLVAMNSVGLAGQIFAIFRLGRTG